MVLSHVTDVALQLAATTWIDYVTKKYIIKKKNNIALNLKMNQPPRLSKRELAMVGY